MAAFAKMKGWYNDIANNRIAVVYNGTHVVRYTATAITNLVATSVTGGITAATSNIVATLGDLRVTAGNVRLGAVSAFATTEPTSAVVMKAGTAPAGAITTSGGIFTDGTTVKKIIADGTVSDVQT